MFSILTALIGMYILPFVLSPLLLERLNPSLLHFSRKQPYLRGYLMSAVPSVRRARRSRVSLNRCFFSVVWGGSVA